jgi:hypothetical protein
MAREVLEGIVRTILVGRPALPAAEQGVKDGAFRPTGEHQASSSA